MLVQTSNGVTNLAHVREIAELDGTPHRLRLTYADGASTIVYGDIGYFERMTGRIIPAPEGYRLVEAVLPEVDASDEAVRYFAHPIVAFRTDSDGFLMPITVRGEVAGVGAWAVVQPDGSCIAYDEDFPTVDIWKAYVETGPALQRRATVAL